MSWWQRAGRPDPENSAPKMLHGPEYRCGHWVQRVATVCTADHWCVGITTDPSKSGITRGRLVAQRPD
jgi:hypothetical protein